MKKILAVLVLLPSFAFAALVVVGDQVVKPGAPQLLANAIQVKTGISADQIAVPVPKEVWTAGVGSSVKSTFTEWAGRKGWVVRWDTKTNYDIEAPLRFEGSIDEAVGQMITLYERAEKPLRVEISLSQKLIYVTNRN